MSEERGVIRPKDCPLCGAHLCTEEEIAAALPVDRQFMVHGRCNSYIHASDLRRIIREELAAALAKS